MRTLILNDTRSHQHIGCELVMQNLLRLCEEAGLSVVATVLNSASDDEAVVRGRANEFDLLVVNGEGTLHHHNPKAVSLCRAACQAARLGKKVVLVNTTWQANQKLNNYLRDFHLVFCRESRSQAAIAAAGCQAILVPDLIFATDLPAASREADRKPRGTLVIDSVDRTTTLAWAWRALRERHAFMTMHDSQSRLLKRRPWLTLGIRAWSGTPVERLNSDWLIQLQRFERVISGRYHGCCLAMLLGIPTIGIPSNTHKIEGMFADAGLGHSAICNSDRPSALSKQFEAVASQMDRVRVYVSRAKREIAAMIERIRGLANMPRSLRQAA